jgi:hypothetical protein
MHLSDLVGTTLIKVENLDNERLIFTAHNNEHEYHTYHLQDCCETVSVYQIVGNIEDILNSQIIKTKELVYDNEQPEPDIFIPDNDCDHYESYTWTIHIIETKKGAVKFVWLGSSNGYYSESVYFGES